MFVEQKPDLKPNPNSNKDVWLGVGLYFLLGILSLPMIFLGGLASIVFYFGGLILAIVWARKRGRSGIIKGLVIAFSISLLLMAACFGLVWFTMKPRYR